MMKRSYGRVWLFATMLALLFVCTFGLVTSALNARAAETSAGVTKAIKITVDTESEAFTSNTAGIGGLNDTDYVVFGVSPLPIMVSDVDRAFKNNALGSWWEPWGDVEFAYDFWSPEPIAGMGGVNFETADYKTVPNDSVVDENGFTSTSTDAAFVEKLSNGWLRRTVRFCSPSQLVSDLYLTFQAQVSDLPESGKIEMYYTNFKLRFAKSNGIVDLFGSDKSLFSADNVNKVAKGEAPAGGAVKPADLAIATGWGTVENFLTVENAANRSLGASFEAGDVPEVCSVSEELPDIFVAGTEYDLLGYVSSSGSVGISSISKDGKPVDISGADFSAFTFAESGRYVITFTASKNGYTAKLDVNTTVASENVPVLLEEDVSAAIPKTGYAHENIALGNVFASVAGLKNLAAVPTVKNSEGVEFLVTETSNGFEFTPTKKKNDTYTVVYMAVNEHGSAVSDEYIVTVTDIDKPVISFDAVGSFNVGAFYSVDALRKSVSVTDISDGTIGIATLSVIDPLGNELIEEGAERFMAAYSGDYTLKVVTEPDRDKNVTTAQATVKGAQGKGLVLGMIVDVSEENRAEGVHKHYHSQIWNVVPTLSLNVGDVISYEVMAYTEYTDGTIGFIPGVGGISGQISGDYAGVSWPLIHDLFDKTECKDSEGYSMAQGADLTDVLQDEEGNAVWYRRSYTVTSGDAIYGGGLYHFALSLDTKAACGESIIVYYKNVNVYDSEGQLKQVLWDGSQNIVGEFESEEKCTGMVVATLDVSPVEIAGKIPTSADFGETISISKNLMKDALTDTVIDTEVTVFGPDGKEVKIKETDTGHEFIADMLGVYKITVFGSNGKYSTAKTYKITVADDGYPVIAFQNDKDGYVVGDTVKVTVSISDNISEFADFSDKGSTVTIGGKAVEAIVTQTDGGYSISFQADKEGDYTILAYGTDAAGNETVETHIVTVGGGNAPGGDESGGEGGCGAWFGTSVLCGAGAFLLAAAALLAIKNKRV